jgi:hypothetical protein
MSKQARKRTGLRYIIRNVFRWIKTWGDGLGFVCWGSAKNTGKDKILGRSAQL